jgi:hypothetical protein
MPPGLLAIETIARETRAQDLPDRLLGAYIGLGHRRFVGLERDSRIVPVESLDDFGGGASGLERGLQLCCLDVRFFY